MIKGISALKRKRTLLAKELAAFEALERHVKNHTPDGDKRAGEHRARLLAGIEVLDHHLADNAR